MKRQKRKEEKKINKEEQEEDAEEDWCFVCKDGGDLMLCDYPGCLKVYHAQCVGKKKSFTVAGKRWICRKHSCALCRCTPKFYCFCCPNSVCRHCISSSKFTHVRGKKGFCKECLELILLAEQNSEYGSNGEKIDFKDRDTLECLFKEYWEIIKEKEGLTSDDVYSADVLLKREENKTYRFDFVKSGEVEEAIDLISDSDTSDKEFLRPMGKGKAQEFIGWASKPLIEFLRSIGIDTTNKLSQYDVDSIIYDYIKERTLFDPIKKKKVICDEKLYSIFGKKSVDRIKIYGLLEEHMAENLVISDEDDSELEDKKKDTMMASKKQRVSSGIASIEKEVSPSVQKSFFASIVPENIKLVYLRRSLVEEFLKQPENFKSKLLGTFVRVKNDARLRLTNSHQLLQVEGIKKDSTADEMDG
ncbi:zinc finger CCCH domain-containing protein 44-like [Pyrus x bretschneideri]|uniref:zinc finger CCCH domain-containing protein 44-like n=1 Tax=Pyrus x bretschneideri TaxID=225117 RepID=UPI00202EFBD6|nr:zinc finger CCCH domain-containing protein 44-like [Pyrus x bretschneideri]